MVDVLNVLISSAGRRVQLMDAFRAAVEDVSPGGKVFAADASERSAAARLADVAFRVPRVDDVAFVDEMLRICTVNRVGLLVPTIDTELAVLARHRADFEAIGTVVAVSSAGTIDIAGDKELTHQWLESEGFPAVRQVSWEALQRGIGWDEFPALVKPRFGSMSQGVARVESVEDLRRMLRPGMLVQSLALGREYTVSVFVSSKGECEVAVPRERLETRAGEVSKARTVRCAPIEEVVVRVADRLPGAFGALNVQLFHDVASGQLAVIEINARFGGGDPLAWEAGADIPRRLLEDVLGVERAPSRNEWQDGVLMLRFDRAVYVRPDGSHVEG